MPPNASAEGYITDGRGAVRVMAIHARTSTGERDRTVHYLYRKKGSRDWLPLGDAITTDDRTSGFEPVAVDPDLDVAYGLEAEGRAG